MKVFHVLMGLMVSAVIGCGVIQVAAAQTLQAGHIEWPPYHMYEGTTLKGIVIEVLDEVSARTGIKFVYRQLPPKRIIKEFRDKTVTLGITSNPVWHQADKDISLFSVPYLRYTQVVLMNKGSGITVTGPKDLRGKVLGCDLGYTYADGFEEAFKNGTITRDDGRSGERGNLQKLAANRVDGIIVIDQSARYYMKELQMNPDDFETVYQFKNSTDLYLRLHISQKALLPALNAALEAMKAEGFIEKIVEKYTQ